MPRSKGPNFEKMPVMPFSMDFTDMCNWSAMARLERPWAICSRMSVSLGLGPVQEEGDPRRSPSEQLDGELLGAIRDHHDTHVRAVLPQLMGGDDGGLGGDHR
jgi:hypothetical protein